MDSGLLPLPRLRRQSLARLALGCPNKDQACFKSGSNSGSGLVLPWGLRLTHSINLYFGGRDADRENEGVSEVTTVLGGGKPVGEVGTARFEIALGWQSSLRSGLENRGQHS